MRHHLENNWTLGDTTMAMSTKKHESRQNNEKGAQSLRELAASFRGAEAAYFNTTKGVLTGRPDDAVLHEVRQMLDERHVAYLFNPDTTRPRPTFSAQGWTSIGLDEIRQHVDAMLEDGA